MGAEQTAETLRLQAVLGTPVSAAPVRRQLGSAGEMTGVVGCGGAQSSKGVRIASDADDDSAEREAAAVLHTLLTECSLLARQQPTSAVATAPGARDRVGARPRSVKQQTPSSSPSQFRLQAWQEADNGSQEHMLPAHAGPVSRPVEPVAQTPLRVALDGYAGSRGATVGASPYSGGVGQSQRIEDTANGERALGWIAHDRNTANTSDAAGGSIGISRFGVQPSSSYQTY